MAEEPSRQREGHDPKQPQEQALRRTHARPCSGGIDVVSECCEPAHPSTREPRVRPTCRQQAGTALLTRTQRGLRTAEAAPGAWAAQSTMTREAWQHSYPHTRRGRTSKNQGRDAVLLPVRKIRYAWAGKSDSCNLASAATSDTVPSYLQRSHVSIVHRCMRTAHTINALRGGKIAHERLCLRLLLVHRHSAFATPVHSEASTGREQQDGEDACTQPHGSTQVLEHSLELRQAALAIEALLACECTLAGGGACAHINRHLRLVLTQLARPVASDVRVGADRTGDTEQAACPRWARVRVDTTCGIDIGRPRYKLPGSTPACDMCTSNVPDWPLCAALVEPLVPPPDTRA